VPLLLAKLSGGAKRVNSLHALWRRTSRDLTVHGLQPRGKGPFEACFLVAVGERWPALLQMEFRLRAPPAVALSIRSA